MLCSSCKQTALLIAMSLFLLAAASVRGDTFNGNCAGSTPNWDNQAGVLILELGRDLASDRGQRR